jgi:arsenical pump membrane protein
VSNLTNLLAIHRLGVSAAGYVAEVAVPAVVAIAITWAALLLWHRRRLRGSFTPPPKLVVADRALFLVAVTACTLLVPALLLGVPVAAAASLAASIVVIAFFVRRRTALRWSLVPWRLVLIVEGLFLVVSAVGPHGLDSALRATAGATGSLRIAATAAVGSNLVNNLPAYLALDRIIPRSQLIDALLGVNLGPLVLPWGSLATLLWLERCRARGVRVPASTFALAGVVLVPVLLVATVGARQL